MRPRAPSLKALAAEINKRFPDVIAEAISGGGYCNTDRPVHGGRLRSPGKGRRGTLLTVWKRVSSPQGMVAGPVIYKHNSAQTYRHNSEVVDWIVNRVARQVYFEVVGEPHWNDDERREALAETKEKFK